MASLATRRARNWTDAAGNRARLTYDNYDRQIGWHFPSPTKPSAFNGATPATAFATARAASTTEDNPTAMTPTANGQGITDVYDGLGYQLVLQWPSSGIDSYDVLIAIEESLIDGLSNYCQVDGHDHGDNESNIFILCNDPRMAFLEAKEILEELGDLSDLRSAYRGLDDDHFCILWPDGLKEFQIS